VIAARGLERRGGRPAEAERGDLDVGEDAGRGTAAAVPAVVAARRRGVALRAPRARGHARERRRELLAEPPELERGLALAGARRGGIGRRREAAAKLEELVGARTRMAQPVDEVTGLEEHGYRLSGPPSSTSRR
jgi:hypothetical protein